MSRLDRFGNGQNPYTIPHRFISTRDRRIDFLRGLAVLGISANHIWPESANLTHAYKFGHFFAFDFADVFLLLSGIVAGSVFFPLLTQQGLGKCCTRSLRRAGQICGVHILCVFAALPIILIFERGLGVTGSSLSPFESTIVSGFARNLLLYRPSVFLDILPVYIGLLLMLPLGLVIFRYSAAVFGVLTLSLWALIWVPVHLAEAGLITLPSLALKTPFFIHPFAAQLLFFTGVAIGIHKREIEALVAAHRRKILIGSVVGLIFSDYMSQMVWTGYSFSHKYYLNPLRLSDLLAVMMIISCLVKPLSFSQSRPSLIEACGRHILTVFAITTVGAVFFTYLNHWLDAGPWVYGLCILANVALCFLAGHLLEQRRTAQETGSLSRAPSPRRRQQQPLAMSETKVF